MINPQLALAFRLASYFERYPISNRVYPLGEATHAITTFISNEEPIEASLALSTQATMATNSVATSASITYYDFCYCVSCNFLHERMATRSSSCLTPVCDVCDRESKLVKPLSFTYYNPMWVLVKEFI